MRCPAFLLLAIFVLSGCATTTLAPDVSRNLKQSQLAAVVYLENKTINYTEMVCKFLWNENRRNVSNFTGLWDVDGEMTTLMAKEMENLHLETRPVKTILSDEATYATLEKDIQQTRGADGMNKPLQLNDEVLTKLQEAGIRYLIVVRGTGFHINTTTLNSTGSITLPAILMVYDINKDKSDYSEPMYMSGRVEWGKTPRNIELNDMAILKDTSNKMVKVTVENYFPKVFAFDQNLDQ